MYSATTKILEAANILEKVAEFLEAEEHEEQAKQAAVIQKEYVEPIKSAANVPSELESKLAATDPEVLSFFRNIVSKKDDANYTPMGGAAEKIAAEEQDPLIAFCLGED